jgi:pimeloyl-ACP methyl ester carboxylesterase
MEPRIQYATTRDGVSIAYTVLGEGTPMVLTTTPFGRLHVYSRVQHAFGGTVDRLAAVGFLTVIYDGRGTGFSDRSATDFSPGARVLDLEAVVDAAGLDRFVLAVGHVGGSAAVTYATEHAEKVSHLIMINAATTTRDRGQTSPGWRIGRGLLDIAKEDWELFTLTLARTVDEFADGDVARKAAEAFRDSMTAAQFVAYMEASSARRATSTAAR